MEQKMELTAFVKWNLNLFSGTFSLSQMTKTMLASALAWREKVG